MPEAQLRQFRNHLLQAGVTARFADRSVHEIREHLEDIQAEAIDAGMPPELAKSHAQQRIGDLDSIAEDIVRRPELKSWLRRHPGTASVCLPIAYVLMLPTIPLFAGVSRAPAIARWSACLMVGAAITAAMLFAMQVSIGLS